MNYSHKNNGFGLIGLILILVVALAVGGGVYYSVKHSNPSYNLGTYENANMSASSSVAGNSSNNPTSLRGLFGLGRNVTCTFSSTTAQGQSSGTVYVSANAMRGDFSLMNANSQSTIDSHMIRQGDYVYFWSSAQGSQGVKMNFSQMTQAQTGSQVQVQNKTAVNLDQQADYKCTDWTVDSSKFVVPTTIKFLDMSAMMQNSMMNNVNANINNQIKVNTNVNTSY